MRNYIILNGVNSNTITGLLISKLPPISKPKIRTQTEEIDGRDGDIVTKLGYSAYDKEIEIGLYGDFDIDEVIAYFNSEGTITFSNEPDKYYKYEILDQINFNKLIRFKTATVRLHVQPFKYPLEETPVEINIQNVTNEAEEMDLDNTADAPMQIDLKGNTSQANDPTPEAPVEVEVVSGDNTIKVEGKNLLDLNRTLGQPSNTAFGNTTYRTYNYETYIKGLTQNNYYANNNVSCSLTNNSFVITNTNGGYGVGMPILLETGENYTLSAEITGTISAGLLRVAYYTESGEYIGGSSSGSNKYVSFTVPNNAPVCVLLLVPEATVETTYTNIQLEKGSSASEFQPYQSTTYPISLGNIELCKIGTYQDSIVKDNGKWYLNKQIGKVVLNGSENWNYAEGERERFSYNIADISLQVWDSSTPPITINNYFSNTNWYVLYTTPSLNNAMCSHNVTHQINLRATQFNGSVENFKAWLSTHNTTVYYVLATPTYEEIEDTTLLSQLNLIEKAKSYDTSTHITQNANKKPFILNATAVQKGTDTAVVDNEGNIYSKPALDIEGSGNIEVYLEDNQMFSIDLTNSSEIIIDTANLEAYDPSTSALMNRQVTGDYSNFKLNTGENTIKVSGNVTKATISNYTRWL